MGTAEMRSVGHCGREEYGARRVGERPWRRPMRIPLGPWRSSAMVLGFIVCWPIGLAILGDTF